MSGPIITDSSALVSLISDTDMNHARALDLSRWISEQHWSLILPGEVLTEAVNVLGKKTTHAIAAETADMLLHSDVIPVVEATPAIRRRALAKFQQQSDSVSFTDCLVMAFADEYGTPWIFGFDEHFTRNGYTLLAPGKFS